MHGTTRRSPSIRASGASWRRRRLTYSYRLGGPPNRARSSTQLVEATRIRGSERNGREDEGTGRASFPYFLARLRSFRTVRIAPLPATLQPSIVNACPSFCQLIPLREVMAETYVVYFYTFSKPPQPTVHYCPHSAGASVGRRGAVAIITTHMAASAATTVDADDESRLISQPPTLERSGDGRGVRWHITPSGQMVSCRRLLTEIWDPLWLSYIWRWPRRPGRRCA